MASLLLVSLLVMGSTIPFCSTSPPRTPSIRHQHHLDISHGAKALSVAGQKFNPLFQDAKTTGNNLLQNNKEAKVGKFAKGYNCPMGANSNGDGRAIIHADPYDCNKYYYCVWGIAKISECPSFLLWSDQIKACDWFWNVDCNNRGRRSFLPF